ncbi:MAG: hypothetical protein CMC05_04105 [Flavobacteriaceae bacterium]|nr:hypothetical protein [Flavobacteriaceae bacterium]|tara:strand:- start:3011 stop:3478 length:468 start_codon:yes stop_codon:yes gene_type:complete
MNKVLVLLVLLFLSTFSWAQKDIDFTYEFNRDDSNPNIVNVTAEIINNLSEDIYFLSESCNELDYYLTTTSDSAEILILIHCNATFPKKIELKANSSYEFETIIKLNGDIKKVGLNLNLVKLKGGAEVEGKLIDAIIKANTESTLMLEGPIKKMK